MIPRRTRPIDKDTDPVTVSCPVNLATSRVFRVGDFVVFNDEAKDAANPGRRSYECAQIVGGRVMLATWCRAAISSFSSPIRAIFTKDHPLGATLRPTIWPAPILNEGDDLAFDILAVASPDPGSDLTVVIQT